MLCMTEEDTDTDDDLREASPLQVSSRRKRKGKKGKRAVETRGPPLTPRTSPCQASKLLRYPPNKRSALRLIPSRDAA